MITDIYIVHNNHYIEKIINECESSIEPFIHYIDEGSKKGKSLAYKIKSNWGARQTPFVILYDKEDVIKALYSEADPDVITTLTKILKNGTIEDNECKD